MNYSLLIQMTMARLGRRKIKTVLMALGIVVSVLATVLIQTAGGGLREAFGGFIDRAYPADSIWLLSGSGLMGGGETRNNLRLSDVDTVLGSISDIKQWDPVVRAGARDIKRNGKNVQTQVMGISDKADQIRRRGATEGEFLSADDIKGRAHVALIGTTTAKNLFPGESPIGSQIFIDNVPFTVKGVLDSIGVDPHGGDQDDMVQLPYTTLMDQMLRIDYISGVTFQAKDINRVEAIATQITTIMRERHQIVQGQEDDFSIITPLQMRQLVDKSFRIFSIFIPLISGTAFLISGLVILGIMLVSIKERTPEIGLRKALGARPYDLQIEIVIEVIMVSAIAALVGLILAQLTVMALAPMLDAKFGIKHLVAPLQSLLIATLVAVSTGVVGAWLPARRAAALNPVEALR